MSSDILCHFYDDFSFSSAWITSSEAEICNQCLQFRKDFLYTPSDEKPVLRIAAESFYRLYLNGQFIGQGPVRGSRSIDYFDAYDVSELLVKGNNTIAVVVQSMNEHENFRSYPVGCAVIAEIPGVVSTDTTWHTRPAPAWVPTQASFAFQQGYRTEIDFTKCDDAWMNSDYIPQNWFPAILFDKLDIAQKKLLPRGIPGLMETLTFPKLCKSADIQTETPADGEDIADILNREQWLDTNRIKFGENNSFTIIPASENAGTALIFDFGRSCTGFFEVEIQADDNAFVTITYGEEIWNGRVRAAFRRYDKADFFTDCYHLRPGMNLLTTPFYTRGSNLVQITIRNSQTEIQVFNPHFRECRYPHQYAQFECNDAKLNRIWQMCQETLSVCTTDTFEDCPWRERSFWINDLIVENASSLAMFGPSALHKHCFELLFSQQYPSGWIPAVCPVKYDEETMPLVLAPTNLFLFVVMRDYYLASGDLETVKKYLPNLAKILETVEGQRGDDGLVAPPITMANLYDWSYELKGLTYNRCRETLFNSLYILAMRLFAELSDIAGENVDKAPYEERIARTAQALHKNAQENGGLLLDNILAYDDAGYKDPTVITSELSLAFALYSGIWNQTEEQRFIDAICSGKYHTPDFYLQTPVMIQLAQHGKILDVLARIRNYWGKYADAEIWNFPEVGIAYTGRDGGQWDNTSFCHGFTTGPAIIMQQYILGIMPIKGGYEQFAFSPKLGDLQWAEGKVITPHGAIVVAWKKLPSGIVSAHISVPEGCSCILPDKSVLPEGKHRLEITVLP